MNILEGFIADHPETADKTYGLALSASLRQAFLCGGRECDRRAEADRTRDRDADAEKNGWKCERNHVSPRYARNPEQQSRVCRTTHAPGDCSADGPERGREAPKHGEVGRDLGDVNSCRHRNAPLAVQKGESDKAEAVNPGA